MHYKVRDKIIEHSLVTRYHGLTGPITQNIAAHQWGVAWLITEFHPDPSPKLLKAALEHDLPEFITGDVSYVAKLEYPDFREAVDRVTVQAETSMGMVSLLQITVRDTWWLKWADLLEGALWCRYVVSETGSRIYGERWGEYTKALKKHLMNASPCDVKVPAEAEHFTKSIFKGGQ